MLDLVEIIMMKVDNMELLMDMLIRLATLFIVGLAVWLPIALSIRSEVRKFTKQLDGLNYELRQPKFIFWIGVVCATIFTVPIIIVPATGNETFTLPVVITFFAFAMLGSYLAVYALQWRISVRYNRLVIRMPFKTEREITIDEITTVKEKYNRIIAYKDAKRVFDMDRHVIGFELLKAQLYEAEKLESTQKKSSFSVRQHKGNIAIGVLGVLFFGGCLIWTIFWPDETVNNFVYMSFSGFFILCVYLITHSLRWKLTVTEDIITMRNMIGKDKAFPLKSITWVDVKKESIILYTGKKKIAKVAVGCSNFPILSERLNSEEIAFVYKGKPVE